MVRRLGKDGEIQLQVKWEENEIKTVLMWQIWDFETSISLNLINKYFKKSKLNKTKQYNIQYTQYLIQYNLI